jgi:two-component system, OmpR family, response regulator
MRLLIVEDEPDLLLTLAQAMREEGYAVDTAEDGREGLDKALDYEYDAVVLDVMLPRMDGFEVLRQLRVRRRTPVLLLTARNRTPDKITGLDAGADDYLAKPFDLHELLARLRALIRRASGEVTNVLTAGDVSVDIGARRVLRSGEVADLTAREYALVEHLMLHRGRVVSRTQLYEHLFDETESTLSNLLDVHVSNVRKKLGHDFITTRRGHGYCIEA